MKVKLLIGTLGALALTGCISLVPDAGPGPDIYRLSPVLAASESAENSETVLLPVVDAPRELKNNRVALVQDGSSVVYAAAARWASSTPEMMQVLMAEHLRTHGGLGVALPGAGVDSRFAVRVTLRHFEATYDQGEEAAPLGVVDLRVQLVSRKQRSIIAEQGFRAVQRSSGLTLGSIVRAIDLAAGDAGQQAALWTAEQIAAQSGTE